ncbi:MAG: polyprenol monophosphomannose synthase [Acidobacteriota bacterium]|nr:polyprenol monophosphomannose synthase [Acidobacteriota bacterium]
MKACVVIPTYNEREGLAALVSEIRKQGVPLDILIVDDSSPDGTGQEAEAISRKDPGVKVLHREKKEGLGRAYQAGFRRALDAGYDTILQMDADLSHDPAVLPLFLDRIKSRDAVFGSRYYRGVRVHNWSFKRLLLSKFSNDFIRLMLRLPTTDTTTAFKCFRRQVLEDIDFESLRGKQNAFLIELVHRTVRRGFRTEEIPFTFREREQGESKMNIGVAFESLFTVLRLALLGK